MIIIDNREVKLINLIKSKSNFKIQYELQNLQLGDIILKKNDKTIIIERKCMTDMIASIKDGRYKEQKIRLLSEVAKNNNNILICYIIEGLITELRIPTDKPIFYGSIVSSIFRDKIPLIQTNNLFETLEIIIRMYDRMHKDITDFFPINSTTITTNNTVVNTQLDNTTILETPENNKPDNNLDNNNLDNNNLYLQSIKKCKKDNITPKLWNQMCYMNIPGISSNIAIKISEIYPTMKSLLEAYTNCSTDNEKELLLANIILTETEKQKRRIGEVISKRVKEYLFT